MATTAETSKQAVNGHAALTKNAKRRLKKKQQQQSQQQPTASDVASTSALPIKDDERAPSSSSIVQEAANIQFDPESEEYKAFSHVFSRFQPTSIQDDPLAQKGEVIYSDDEALSDQDASDAEDRNAATHYSKRKQKKMQRLTVAELKQLVRRPEVVEWTDVTANDPRLLVHLKCLRNSVPIPPHWGQKRDYLQNKRGIEKPQYQLPSYIADTGIATMKDALKDKEAEHTLKQKTRDRVQPKMGKMDIDYQKLYDAFFKFQHRPPLTPFGDTYYEGKEYETKYKDKRPGHLSADLVEALSIPPLAPPPWLIAMQRYGPPPSYPHLKIPGLNTPIPEGATWGFHPGGWGRPPVDENGNPLYGDVLGSSESYENQELADPVNKEPWGALEPEEEDDEEEDEEEEDVEEEAEPVPQRQEPSDGLHTPSGMQSVTSSVGGGMRTPSFIELRKDGRGDGEGSEAPRSLYQVLPERQGAVHSRFMGSDRSYDLSHASHPHASNVLGAEDRGTKRKSGQVDVSINPDELGDNDAIAESTLLSERYDDARRANAPATSKFSQADDAQGLAEVRQQMQLERQKQMDKRARRN